MSEQLYYTYSTIGSGSTTGERIRAQSPGVGSANSDAVRALMKYLSYRLPAGADVRTPTEGAPLSLALVKTPALPQIPSSRILLHKKYVDRDGIGRAGNFFTHAIINPEVISEQTGVVEAISARTAISLWKSPLWKISESQAPAKSTSLESLTPQEIQQRANENWPGKLSTHTLQQERQLIADVLPQIFSAFLMLERLNKTQLYIAAPAEIVATFIWCITRCLPRTLDIMQNLTFSTYEPELGKIQVTIAGTCWLPPAHHSGPFIPQNDLPASTYQPQPGNPVLAINYYTGNYTPFEIDEQVVKFTAFTTLSLLQSMTQLDKIITQAEKRGYQKVDDFLALFRIQQEEPTKEMVQNILITPKLWPCLHYTNVQKKLVDLIYKTKESDWQTWWDKNALGWKYLKQLYQWALTRPQSEEAAALRSLTECIMNELYHELSNNQEGSTDWAMYWDQLLQDISSPSTTGLSVWATLPLRLSTLPYNPSYQSWWKQSGKKTIQGFHHLVCNNITRPETPQLSDALSTWSQHVLQNVKLAWKSQQIPEMGFWLDMLSTIQPPTNGSQDWNLLLKDLDRAIPSKNLPVHWCNNWETYKTLLIDWYVVLNPQPLPGQWLSLVWDYLPRLLEISELPSEWKTFALEERILLSPVPASGSIPYVARCAPLVHQVLVQMIKDDYKRERAVTFCASLLQQDYTQHTNLLDSIMPPLFSYQDFTNQIAAAAGLPPEQLNEYVEGPLHEAILSQPDISPRLFPQLESYLTNFPIQMINPDRQVNQEKRNRAYAILEELMRRNQALPESLRPYIFCWYGIYEFFSLPIFYPGKLQVMRKQIDAVIVSDGMRRSLNQEVIGFLSEHVETELELGRVIDNLGRVLIQDHKGPLPTNTLLLKEMARNFGEKPQYSYSLQKTIMYIKAVLTEAIALEKLSVQHDIQQQFAHECLDSLLASLDSSIVKSIQTTQWPLPIVRLWDSYRLQRTTAKPKGMASSLASMLPQLRPGSSPATNAVSTQSSAPVSSLTGGNQQPIILSDPSHAKHLSSPANNIDPQTAPRGPRDNAIEVQNKPNKVGNIDAMLKTFNKALRSRRADKIAEAYKDAIDSALTSEQRHIASVCRQLLEDYNAYIRSESLIDQNKLVNSFNTVNSTNLADLLDYPEMNRAIDKIRKKLAKGQEK